MNIDRDELRKLAEAATKGPWVAKTCEPCAEHGREDMQVWDESGTLLIAQWMDEGEDAPADAAFIAASRQALPELIDALDKAEARLQMVRDQFTEPWAPSPEGDVVLVHTLRHILDGDA